MATQEIEISQLELADNVLADMVMAVDTATDTRAITLKQLKAWLGSSLPTGFIVPAVGKIDDTRFTLLDGKTLSKAGTYLAFCNKVVEQVQKGNWFACSEEEYQADIQKYGQCGKFVVSTDYVRIPKITRFIGATVTLSEIGKTYAESLPNIKTKEGAGIGSRTGYYKGDNLAPFTNLGNVNGGNGVGSASQFVGPHFGFDASLCSEAYQDSAKVQPDHTRFPYYMVISTEGQSAPISIDINQVYEDIALKADSNLANVSAVSKTFTSQSANWAMPSEKYIDITDIYYNKDTVLPDPAPADGYYWHTLKMTAGDGLISLVDLTTGLSAVSATRLANTNGVILPVRKGDIIRYYAGNVGGGKNVAHNMRFYYAEGSK